MAEKKRKKKASSKRPGLVLFSTVCRCGNTKLSSVALCGECMAPLDRSEAAAAAIVMRDEPDVTDRDEATTEIADIDVARAKEMLGRPAPTTRTVRNDVVDRYALQMKKDKWVHEPNHGHPILLDSKLRLVNGRHRLLAVVKSGVPLKGVAIVTLVPKRTSKTDHVKDMGDFADAVRPPPKATKKATLKRKLRKDS